MDKANSGAKGITHSGWTEALRACLCHSRALVTVHYPISIFGKFSLLGLIVPSPTPLRTKGCTVCGRTWQPPQAANGFSGAARGGGGGDSAITLGAGWGAQAGECRDPRELAIRLYLSFNVK